ncbi:acyl-CoA oxidase [Nocardioides luteus]|uniref:Acyl-CoA oxidase n=1 Tax=Nocardioides luteus TaxID=1844 RepID=A0ABQ5SYR7_9ACTN|nr:acyl-CoA dehydrogenase [Nocardioides luteus]MDR7312722.1 acyl-CoA oxidase [Nocardioides luteus]GGR47110.1 acyl-CoA oxidase [Nocardioides luteus]GLJ68974.1 acyl-CoA oxidase [Nocardioides luteus]
MTAIDASSLTALLDGRYAGVREDVRKALIERADFLDEVEELPRAEYRERVRAALLDVSASGLTALGFPKEYGGGGDVGASIAAFEEMAGGDLSLLVKSGVQFGLFGGAILQLGTARHHDRYLADIVSGRLLGCFAMTEHGHGSNVAAVATVATYDADAQEFVIETTREDAYKDYIGNAACHGEVAVVFAQLVVAGEERGVHAFVVPIRVSGEPAPGVRIADDGPKMGLNGVDNGRLWFSGVRVPRTALLNRFADVTETGEYVSEIESAGRRFFTMLGTLVQGRVSVGGAAIRASEVALTIAVRYALQRRQFEASSDETESLLLDYGQHQRRLLPLVARTYAMRFAQEIVRNDLHDVFSGVTTSEHARRELESRAAGTKAMATWHATRTIQECREACGGAGYLSANRFAALKADTDVFTTFEGDNTVLLQLVAKGLLTGYSSEFEEMDQLDMVRFVAGLAVETVLERTAVHKLLERVRDVVPVAGEREPDILDSEYHLAMLRFREEHMLAGVARRLQSGIKDGREPGEVFSNVQDHVISVARAHIERLIHEAFREKVLSMPEGPERELMGTVCDLNALSVIEADRAWFMEHGRLSSERSKAITAEVNRLCRDLRPHARLLVDGFGVPEVLLRAEELIG